MRTASGSCWRLRAVKVRTEIRGLSLGFRGPKKTVLRIWVSDPKLGPEVPQRPGFTHPNRDKALCLCCGAIPAQGPLSEHFRLLENRYKATSQKSL